MIFSIFSRLRCITVSNASCRKYPTPGCNVAAAALSPSGLLPGTLPGSLSPPPAIVSPAVASQVSRVNGRNKVVVQLNHVFCVSFLLVKYQLRRNSRHWCRNQFFSALLPFHHATKKKSQHVEGHQERRNHQVFRQDRGNPWKRPAFCKTEVSRNRATIQ